MSISKVSNPIFVKVPDALLEGVNVVKLEGVVRPSKLHLYIIYSELNAQTAGSLSTQV